MRKKSLRFISAALAVSMMASTLPVGAFALEVGAGETTAAVSEQKAATTLPYDGGTIGAGHYIMEGGNYTGGFTIDTTGDVTIDITGEVTAETPDILFYVLNVGTLTSNGRVNGKDCKVSQHCTEGKDDGTGVLFHQVSAGTVVFNGGDYTALATYGRNPMFSIVNKNGTLELHDVTAHVKGNDNYSLLFYGGKVDIYGGNFSAESTSYALLTGGEGSLTTNGGKYQSACCVINAFNSEGEATINGSEMTVSDGAVIDVSCKKMTINDGIFTLLDGPYIISMASKSNLTINDGQFIANGANTIAFNTKYYQSGGGGAKSLTINKATIKGCKKGILAEKNPDLEQISLDNVNIENADVDIELEQIESITLGKKFSNLAKIKVDTPAKDRTITTATPGETYQKDLKLVSLNDGWVIDWDKDNGNRYLTKRDDGKNYVNPINATMTVDGEEKRPYSQFTPGDKVTLNAFSNEGSEKFTRWKVEKIAAEGVKDVSEEVKIDYKDPENPETATLTVPDYDVFVTAEYKKDEGEIVDPGTGDSDYGGDIAAGVVIGGIAAVGAYEVGTGLYRILAMDDVAMPTNRIALAKLLWERAGKPEPESTALYSDISAEDTDAQKAARWAVEQELLNDAEDGKFHPAFPVSKLRVCLTWEKAKQKGLFDKTEA